MRGHAIHDNMAYVPKALIEEWTRRDPIARFEEQLRARGVMDDEKLEALRARVEREIDDAVAFAESAPLPDPATVTEGVYAEDSSR
jgi:pyruvate dehydrogenase E1 component alpha subunit